MKISLSKVAALTIGGFLSAAAALAPARAATYDWTLSSQLGFGGLPFQASGTLTTSDTPTTNILGDTGYLITGITGTLGGDTITGLLPADGSTTDNLLFTAAGLSSLDLLGLSFVTDAGIAAHVFSDLPGLFEEDVTIPAGYPSSYPIAPQGFGSFTLTQVPEPASLALLGAGLFGLGFIRRRRA